MSNHEIDNTTSEAMKSGNPLSNSRDRTARVISYCALSIALLTFLFGDNVAWRIYLNIFLPQQKNQTIIEGIIALLNVGLAILVLVDLRILRPIKTSTDNSPASNSFKQLLQGWQFLWFTWMLFYVCLAVQWLHFSGDKSSVLWRVSDALNMVNGFFFYYLFFVLDQPSVPTEAEPNRARSFRHNCLITLALGFSLFVISVIIPSPNNSAGGQHLDKAVLLPKLVPAYIAVGMAFFFGRLDSHYLKLHRVILAPLYLYAIIQLFWERNTFESPEFNGERVAIFSLALVLKFVVFLNLSKLIRHESFRKYFVVAEKGLRES